MPTYDLRCNACGGTAEVSASIHEATPDRQPCECGGEMRRVFAWGGTAVLKGTGWAKHPDREVSRFKKGPQD